MKTTAVFLPRIKEEVFNNNFIFLKYFEDYQRNSLVLMSKYCIPGTLYLHILQLASRKISIFKNPSYIACHISLAYEMVYELYIKLYKSTDRKNKLPMSLWYKYHVSVKLHKDSKYNKKDKGRRSWPSKSLWNVEGRMCRKSIPFKMLNNSRIPNDF